MTSFRQIEANRRNALRSTGPTTQEGKRRSRRNAVRHGLTAETVVETIEDIEDYRGFEAAVIADYDARTAVERELVLRLASLLWRLRRATAIETDLGFRIQAEIRQHREFGQPSGWSCNTYPPLIRIEPYVSKHCDQEANSATSRSLSTERDLAHCFLRLVNLDNGAFERLGRYDRLSRVSELEFFSW